MSKIESARKIYQRNGLRELFKVSVRHLVLYNSLSPYRVLVGSPGAPCLSPYLKSLFGKSIHQKLYACPRLGYWPQIETPRTFNEKILNRKLNTNNEMYTKVEDKYQVRNYVADKVGSYILPELYHVAQKPDTIPFDSLPETYVIKPTHLTNARVILVDEEVQIDEPEIRNKCHKWLNKTKGHVLEEYWYKSITPRIIVEERLQDDKYGVPLDFKFMVFHGRVEAIHVTLNRFNSEKKTVRTFYNRNWEMMNVELFYDKGPELPEPKQLDKMIEIAEALGEDFDHIRVDLYAPNDETVVFGEMTVAEGSGKNPFVPREYDFKFGSYW